ncbi:MAG: class I SAM-dependent methyltransferase [Firmicutes bacterium]|nr:class I SAM-dependent methyltransferase [Bacillota bacterium]
MNRTNNDYSIIATGDGYKLERWGEVTLLRPDPQVIWTGKTDLAKYPRLDAHYVKEGGGGKWRIINKIPEQWTVSFGNLKFWVKPMGFKHTGLFPEQAVNWEKIRKIVGAGVPDRPNVDRQADGDQSQIKVLNLFAYTGGATIAAAAVGAKVTHVDSATNMVERAKQNATLNKLPPDSIRYIVDDCLKFVKREQKRGKKYDAVIMDPPSYGRGPNGELWKLEDNLFALCTEVSKVLEDKPLFFLINSYTTGLQPTVLSNILRLIMGDRGKVEAYELNMATEEKRIVLPCGASGIWTSE